MSWWTGIHSNSGRFGWFLADDVVNEDPKAPQPSKQRK